MVKLSRRNDNPGAAKISPISTRGCKNKAFIEIPLEKVDEVCSYLHEVRKERFKELSAGKRTGPDSA